MISRPNIPNEDFPGKKELLELENLMKTSVKIYHDDPVRGLPVYSDKLPPGAAEAGYVPGSKLKDEIKKLLTSLKKIYGGKALKFGNEYNGVAQYRIFIPISQHHNLYYDGIVVDVSLVSDQKLASQKYRKPYTKYFWIEIYNTDVRKEEAKNDYNCITIK